MSLCCFGPRYIIIIINIIIFIIYIFQITQKDAIDDQIAQVKVRNVDVYDEEREATHYDQPIGDPPRWVFSASGRFGLSEINSFTILDIFHLDKEHYEAILFSLTLSSNMASSEGFCSSLKHISLYLFHHLLFLKKKTSPSFRMRKPKLVLRPRQLVSSLLVTFPFNDVELLSKNTVLV